MKRFLSIMLTAFLLVSAVPTVSAEETVDEIGSAVAEALNNSEDEETITDAEETVETEENDEEIETQALDDEVSVLADTTAEYEVEYRTDGGTNWTGSSLSDAVTAIGKETGTIRVLKDITLTQGIAVLGKITIDAYGNDVVIKRGFATGTATESSSTGDSMFSVYNSASKSQATLTLGSADNSHTLTIDGNKEQCGSNNAGSIIYSSGTSGKSADITINKNVVLQNNKSSKSGGAVYSCGYANITIDGASFLNNEVYGDYSYGGALCIENINSYNDANSYKLIVNNGTFSNNSAESSGGAICTQYSGTAVSIKNSTFDSNSAQKGSAIDAESMAYKSGRTTGPVGIDEALVIENVTFTNNTYNSKQPNYNVPAYTYSVSNTIYLGQPSYHTDKTISLKGKINFTDNNTNSDICLYAYGYGTKTADPVIYLDDGFGSDSKIKVMPGAYAIASSADDISAKYGIPLFKCGSSDNAAKFTEYLTCADDGDLGKCNKASGVTFVQSGTDIQLAEYVEPEVEYAYLSYTSESFVSKTDQGTLLEALTSIKSSGNTGTIKLLKDIEIEDTIGTSSNDKYATATLKEIDGNGFTITRASGFTGEMIHLGAYTCNVHDVTLDGQNADGCEALIVAPVVGNSKGTHLVLKDATLCRNTNSAIKAEGQVECTGVTVEDCSADKGGAVNIYRSSSSGTQSYSFTNCTFKNNKAAAGSAIFMKSVDGSAWFDLSLSGCTFTGNRYAEGDESIDKETTHTVVYVGTDANPENVTFSSCLNLYGDTIFSDNGDTVSDILLDEGFTNLTTYANLKLGTGSSNPKFANKGEKPIRIAVGSYSRSGDAHGFEAVKGKNIINKQSSVVSYPGAFELAPTFGATLSGDHVLKEGTNYFTISEPTLISMRYSANNNKIEATAIIDNDTPKKGFNVQSGGNVTLCVSPSFHTEYDSSAYKNVDKAYENKEYILTATAGESVKITSFSVKLNTGNPYKPQYTEIASATIPEDGKTAVLKLTPEIFAQVLVNTIKICTVNIEYEVLAQSITVDSVTGGTISTDPSGSANVGSTVKLTASPNDNYEFGEWNVYKTGEPSTKVTVSDNSFIMPDYGVTVSASFTKKKHAVTVEVPVGGTLAIDKDSPVEVGETVTITATPSEHYVLDTLTVTTASGTSVAVSDNKFTMPNESVTVKATFKKQQFTVTAESTENGTIDLISATPCDWGENFTITVTADAYYEIDTVTVDGSTVTVNEHGDYTFEMPTHDVIVSATFKKKQYNMTTSGDHVTFNPSNGVYTWGDTVEFTVTPEKWYSLKSVSAKDQTVGVTAVADKENTYSFTMPKGDVTITAVAERPNFNVKFDSQGGSAVDAKVVPNGNTVEKPGVPTWAGRGFAGWYTDSACTKKYDFATEVTANLTLYARWFLWGDVNGDGVADSYDALLIQRCRVGLTDYSLIKNRMAGLVTGLGNGKNYPDSMDAVTIQRYRVGLINRFAVEDIAAGYEFDLENDTYSANS